MLRILCGLKHIYLRRRVLCLIPGYVMSCYVMLCYVMLCYVMLCYVMLCYVYGMYIMYMLLQTTWRRHRSATSLKVVSPGGQVFQVSVYLKSMAIYHSCITMADSCYFLLSDPLFEFVHKVRLCT